MATGFDIRLIDPTEKALATALKKAHEVANRSVTISERKLERDLAFWTRFAHDCLREPEGRRRSCKAGFQTPEVIAGWWTDPAHRRHFRIIGRTRSRWRRMRGEGELRDLPPWWQVYPECVLAVRDAKSDDERYLACCRCGKVGTPESLGWMGDSCGPCFDHRTDGGVTVGGYGHSSGWVSRYSRGGFSANSSKLVGQHRTNRLRILNLLDHSEVLGRKVSTNIIGVVESSRGFLFALTDGSVHSWDGGKECLRLLTTPGNAQPVLSPDGRWAVASRGTGYTADLSEPKPTYTHVVSVPSFALMRFSPNGKRVYAISSYGELVALDPATLAQTPIREQLFEGLPSYGTVAGISVSPDESMVAVLREHYPAGHTIRIIPLTRERAAYDLPLPNWHKPHSVAFAPDGKHIATADSLAGWVGFWRLPSGKSLGFVRAVLEDPSYRGGQLMFSPDGRALAVVYTGLHQERGSTAAVWPWPDVMAAASE